MPPDAVADPPAVWPRVHGARGRGRRCRRRCTLGSRGGSRGGRGTSRGISRGTSRGGSAPKHSGAQAANAAAPRAAPTAAPAAGAAEGQRCQWQQRPAACNSACSAPSPRPPCGAGAALVGQWGLKWIGNRSLRLHVIARVQLCRSTRRPCVSLAPPPTATVCACPAWLPCRTTYRRVTRGPCLDIYASVSNRMGPMQ